MGQELHYCVAEMSMHMVCISILKGSSVHH